MSRTFCAERMPYPSSPSPPGPMTSTIICAVWATRRFGRFSRDRLIQHLHAAAVGIVERQRRAAEHEHDLRSVHGEEPLSDPDGDLLHRRDFHGVSEVVLDAIGKLLWHGIVIVHERSKESTHLRQVAVAKHLGDDGVCVRVAHVTKGLQAFTRPAVLNLHCRHCKQSRSPSPLPSADTCHGDARRSLDSPLPVRRDREARPDQRPHVHNWTKRETGYKRAATA